LNVSQQDVFILLRGRPTGRITGLARLSVLPYGLMNQKRKDAEKPKSTWTFPTAGVTGVSICSSEGQG